MSRPFGSFFSGDLGVYCPDFYQYHSDVLKEKGRKGKRREEKGRTTEGGQRGVAQKAEARRGGEEEYKG